MAHTEFCNMAHEGGPCKDDPAGLVLAKAQREGRAPLTINGYPAKAWPYGIHDRCSGALVASLTIEGPADGVGMLSTVQRAFDALFDAEALYFTAPPMTPDGRLR